jgi:hypothetical protein
MGGAGRLAIDAFVVARDHGTLVELVATRT